MNKKIFVFVSIIVLLVVFVGCGQKNTVDLGSEKQEKNAETEIKIQNAKEVASSYDLIVVDGSPEGVSAAVSAARNGLKTLLICQDNALGGLYTLGELNFIDVPETKEGKLLVKGIYKEFFDKVGGSGFEIVRAKNTFYQMVNEEKNITLRVESKFVKPVIENNRVTGIEVEEENKKVVYKAPLVIDATPDGDVCAAAGAPFTMFGEDIGEGNRAMGVTLVFSLSGADWDAIVKHVSTPDKNANGSSSSSKGGATDRLAWGYGEEGFAYIPQDKNLRMRGFNIARQDNGDVLLNALIIFDVDALDEKSKKEGIERGKKELTYFIKYLNEVCPGFEKAKLSGTAEQLYVRETRHIECENMLTIDDVLENRGKDDAIAVTNYPVDVQASKEQRYGMVLGFPDQYAISFGSLVPKKIDGLMIVGRSAGYRSLAAGSARIVPTGMACGQAAGVAAKICLDNKISPRDLFLNKQAIRQMQNKLQEQGANLEHTQKIESVMNHWAYPGVRVLRSLAIVSGGYDNDYKLDEPITGKRFANIANAVVKKSGLSLEPRIAVNDVVKSEEMTLALAKKLSSLENLPTPKTVSEAETYLKNRGIINDQLAQNLSDKDNTVDAGTAIVLCAKYYEYLINLAGAKNLLGADPINLH